MRLFALLAIAAALPACWTSSACDVQPTVRHHDISAAQRAMIEAGDAGASVVTGCESVCWSFDTDLTNQHVTCMIGAGDGGDAVTCTYPRFCR
jgi:hypothetical protein